MYQTVSDGGEYFSFTGLTDARPSPFAWRGLTRSRRLPHNRHMPVDLPSFTFVRDLVDSFETRHQHARAAKARTERRIARGVYLDAATWHALSDDAKYAARVKGIVLTRRFRAVASHWSAAVLHGLPIVGRWPEEVHLTVPGTGGSVRAGVVRHVRRLDDDDVVEVDGMLVTSVARTVLDTAAVASRFTAVAMADRALLVDRFRRREPLTTKDDLLAHWERMLPFRGHVRSRDVIEFAATRAESPLESVSRVTMRQIGCPQPELQVSHYDDAGFIGDTDFAWPEFGVVGEADGEGKYRDPILRGGRSTEQVVLEEKGREDRLRGLDLKVRRWGWEVACDPARLRNRLASAGLPTGIRRRSNSAV